MAEDKGRRLALEWVEESGPRRLALPEVGVVRLGRDPESDVVFDELDVSRRHAEVRCGPSGPVLHHLSRKSPTWHNGRLLVAAAPIADGDVIRLSTVELFVRAHT